MESLLSVLRESFDTSTLSPYELEDAFDRAEAENVLPLFLANLRSGNLTLPQDLDLRYSAAERGIAVDTFWWTSQLRGILQAFAAETVPLILLKGPCMAERLYGGAGLRTSRDIDLLVHPKDLAAAGEILEALGFVRGLDDEGRHQTWTCAKAMVELHFDLVRPDDLRIDLGRIFANAVPVTFAGKPAHVLSSPDELLFLCLHGIKHSYEQLSHVIDVAFALKNYGSRSDYAVCAEDEGFIAPVLALGYAMAQKLDLLESPAGSLVSPKAVKRIDGIAESLWSRFFESPATQNLWRYPSRLFLALRPTFLTRMRYLCGVLGAISDEDRALAGRLHIEDRRLTAFIRKLRLVFKIVCRGWASLSRAF